MPEGFPRSAGQPGDGGHGLVELLLGGVPALAHGGRDAVFEVVKTTDGHGITIGPILLGSAFPAHVMTPSATVRRLVNMTALAVAEVAAGKKHKAGGVA